MIRATVPDGTQGVAQQPCCDDPTPGYHAEDAYHGKVYCEACDTTLFVVLVEDAPTAVYDEFLGQEVY